jgi:hypothetical protein
MIRIEGRLRRDEMQVVAHPAHDEFGRGFRSFDLTKPERAANLQLPADEVAIP